MTVSLYEEQRTHRKKSHVKVEAKMSDVATGPGMPGIASSYQKLR